MSSPSVLPTVPACSSIASRNSSWSDSGTPSRSATTSMASGAANRETSSVRPSGPRAWSSCSSTMRRMKRSFSFRRFGVIIRASSARWAVCTGGSSVGSWSLKGSSSRCRSMSSVMSSCPSSGTGKPGNGPVTEVHDEKCSVSL